ncbi:MAG TPA: amino acid permease [Longimicrobiales bacterium]|nr:amino acid permease [Longimicrobiales bacterium]
MGQGTASGAGYVRRIGVFDGTMMVMGGIIGAGIFINPSVVAARVPSAELALGAWLLGGAIALAGAFCFAELGARRPRAGGGYAYLREAFGPLPAFLYGWALLLIIATGAIAAVAVTFARYLTAVLGAPAGLVTPMAVGAILLLSVINYFGVRPGAITQNIFTVLKLVALAALIIVGVVATSPLPAPPSVSPSPAPSLVDTGRVLGLALIPILFSYGGWQQTNFVAEEMVRPERTLPRALLLGVSGVVLVYVAANWVYLRQLGLGGLAESTAPAADVMRGALGESGATLIATGIAISTFGFLNLVILVSPRVYQAMAADGVFLPELARLHPRWRTPVLALLLQAGWAVLLTLSGTYGQLLDYVVFGDWIFFGLTAATLFVYRRREPDAPYRAPLHPVLPLLFVLAAAYVVISSVVSNPRNALVGTLLIALGVPVYGWARRRAAAAFPGM